MDFVVVNKIDFIPKLGSNDSTGEGADKLWLENQEDFFNATNHFIQTTQCFRYCRGIPEVLKRFGGQSGTKAATPL